MATAVSSRVGPASRLTSWPGSAGGPDLHTITIVLRDGSNGVEVLMARRAERPGDQNSGAAVFPGGLLDNSDRGHYARCNGLDDAAASARLGLASDGLHYWVAAVRECFEEAGLLFATDANFKVQPQMVDKFDISADKLTYTFTLRVGL